MKKENKVSSRQASLLVSVCQSTPLQTGSELYSTASVLPWLRAQAGTMKTLLHQQVAMLSHGAITVP